MLLNQNVYGRRYKLIFKCIRSRNNFFVIQYLKNYNPDLASIKDENDVSIFMNIIKYGTNEMLKYFMSRFPEYNLDECDNQGVHSLFYLLKRKDLSVEYVRSFFIRCQQDINIWSEHYGCLLFHSIKYNNLNAFSLLISMGADVNGLDNERNPLIFYCVLNGLIQISSVIISAHDFNVNVTNNANESILEIAIVKAMSLHAKLLIKQCPSVLKDKDTVLKLMDYAIDTRNTIIAWLIYQHYSAHVIQKFFKNRMKKSEHNVAINDQ